MLNQSTNITEVSEPGFLWLGEHRALDFLNTEPIVRGQRLELLGSFEQFLAWCTAAGCVAAEHAADALARWGTSRGATQTLATAHRLRGELRLALEHRGEGERRLEPSLEVLHECLRLGGTSTQVRAGPEGRYRRHVIVTLTKPEELLRPVAVAAVDLLCDVEPKLVRRCDNPECVLYFHDVSKNHARRWCSMALCGNRMKVAAHHRRRRAKGASD